MTMRINANSASAWRHFDSEAVRNTQGGIHHGESAIQNVRAIGEDAMHAVIPLDRAVMVASIFGYGGEVGLGIVGALLGFLWDLAELLVFPFMFLWNLINVAGHGGAAAVNAVNGENDGEVEHADVATFNFESEGSLERIVTRRHRTGGSLSLAGLATPLSTGVSIARRSSSSGAE